MEADDGGMDGGSRSGGRRRWPPLQEVTLNKKAASYLMTSCQETQQRPLQEEAVTTLKHNSAPAGRDCNYTLKEQKQLSVKTSLQCVQQRATDSADPKLLYFHICSVWKVIKTSLTEVKTNKILTFHYLTDMNQHHKKNERQTGQKYIKYMNIYLCSSFQI